MCHSAMTPAAVNTLFPRAMPEDPVVKYHCKKCGEEFLSSNDFRVHINTKNCRVGIDVYDSYIKLQNDGGDRCSYVNASQSNNQSNEVNDSTEVQLSITELIKDELDLSNGTRTGTVDMASTNEPMKDNLDQSKERKTNIASVVLLTKELNHCVLAKKNDTFYPGTVKTINRKGTVGVLFKGEEELTYFLNALDPNCKFIISISVPTADTLKIGCKVCVCLTHERNMYYDGEITDTRSGQQICYKVCLVHDKDIDMFGEALWVSITAVRRWDSPWYNICENKMGLTEAGDITGNLQVLIFKVEIYRYFEGK